MLAWSPDGRIPAVGRETGRVSLCGWPDGRELRRLEAHRGPVSTLGFSPDGLRLATGSWREPEARFWNADTGEPRFVLDGHDGGVRWVGFSPDGRLAATRSAAHAVRIVAADDGSPRPSPQSEKGHRIARFLPDGRMVLLTAKDSVAFWDLAEGRILEERRLGAYAGHLVISADAGTWAASWSEAATVTLLDGGTLKAVRRLRGPTITKGTYEVAVSPDGRMVATVGLRGAARVWDAATGRERVALDGPEEGYTRAAFSADGRFLALGAGDGVRVFAMPWPETDDAFRRGVTGEPTRKSD